MNHHCVRRSNFYVIHRQISLRTGRSITSAYQRTMNSAYPAATSGSRSKLISGNFKKIVSGPGISHPQKNFTAQLHDAEQRSTMSSNSDIKTGANSGFPDSSNAPGEHFEPRQTATSEDYEPIPSKSIKLSPARQRLVDDVRTSLASNVQS